MRVKSSLLLACLLASTSVFAIEVFPSSYDMPNGSSLGFTYFDDTYSGAGCKTCDGAALTGGLGDLTDGVVASGNWNVVEAPTGPGPYVGWVGLDPTITIHFGQSVSIGSVTFNFDDSASGGVVAPLGVVIAGQSFSVVNPPGTAPFSFTVSGLGFVGTNLPIVINRASIGAVTMVSEISFASTVPEPGSGEMLFAGLAVGVGVFIRRRGFACARRPDPDRPCRLELTRDGSMRPAKSS